MLLKSHEIRYILRKAKGAGKDPQVSTKNSAYLLNVHGGYIEVLIGGAHFHSEKRSNEIQNSYQGILPVVTDDAGVPDGFKRVLWHCELPQMKTK
jgi:hypothetical protein